jgi:hypothetical protein
MQERCLPFGGTLYGWYTDHWYGTGTFSVGRQTRHADILDINTGFLDNGNMWMGTEDVTFDFGKGNTFQMKAEFLTEHMTDAVSASGFYDVRENGTFTHGTGMFKGAYGHWVTYGPFGPAVKLPDDIKPAPDATMYWIGHYDGTICGIR